MKPMLAFRYQDKKKHLTFPCHVQPKLNGVRLIYHDGRMWSRSHKKIEPIQWASDRLSHLRLALSPYGEEIIFDGELYIHGWSLQRINSAASVNRLADTDATLHLEYHIFDCVLPSHPLIPFAERFEYLRDFIAFNPSKHIKLVPTNEVTCLEQAEQLFLSYKLAGYEGAIYRQSDSPYGHAHLCGNQDNRWPFLLKRKDWLDDWFPIVGFEITTGEKGERGFQMKCMTKDGKYFNVGSGLSDMELDAYEIDPPTGKQSHVKFEMYSDGGIPLKATNLEIE